MLQKATPDYSLDRVLETFREKQQEYEGLINEAFVSKGTLPFNHPDFSTRECDIVNYNINLFDVTFRNDGTLFAGHPVETVMLFDLMTEDLTMSPEQKDTIHENILNHDNFDVALGRDDKRLCEHYASNGRFNGMWRSAIIQAGPSDDVFLPYFTPDFDTERAADLAKKAEKVAGIYLVRDNNDVEMAVSKVFDTLHNSLCKDYLKADDDDIFLNMHMAYPWFKIHQLGPMIPASLFTRGIELIMHKKSRLLFSADTVKIFQDYIYITDNYMSQIKEENEKYHAKYQSILEPEHVDIMR